jgi:hypothetical protein
MPCSSASTGASRTASRSRTRTRWPGPRLRLVDGRLGESFNNSYDYEYNWGPSAYDIKHSYNGTFVYELPFGRNHKLGGWQFSGMLFIRSGYALTVSQTQAVQSTGKGNRPDQIGPGTVDDPTIDQWFDTRFCRYDANNPNWRDPSQCSFAEPQDKTATYGNAKKGSLRGPGQTTLDLALIKVTQFGRIRTELRAEAFNALNHPTFNNPNTQLGSSTAGVIPAAAADTHATGPAR